MRAERFRKSGYQEPEEVVKMKRELAAWANLEAARVRTNPAEEKRFLDAQRARLQAEIKRRHEAGEGVD